MYIIDRHLIKNFFTSFLYCLAIFIFLYVIIDLFGHLDEILKNSVPLFILQQYYLSMIPLIILHTAPIASLIASINVISTMNRNDEITAMRAAGINIYRVLAPLIMSGIIISISVFIVSEKAMPVAIKTSQTIRENYIETRSKTKDKPDAISNIALYGKNNALIFIKSYEMQNNIIKNLTIIEQDKHGNAISKINALEGKWNGQYWMLSNMLVYKLDKEGNLLGSPLFFENNKFDLESPSELVSKGTNYEFMSFKDLYNYIKNFSGASKDISNRLLVDLHQKLSIPFTSLVLILIGAAFAVRVKKRGKHAGIIGIGISIIIGFTYYALMATFIALGKGQILHPLIAAHIANIIFIALGLFLIEN